MNWVMAMSSGFGLGVLYFGGLWRSVRMYGIRERTSTCAVIGRFLRLGMAAIVFHALLKSGGIASLLSGLLGVLLGRWLYIRETGKTTHGW